MSDILHNTPWNELEVGAWASLYRACTPQDLLLFAQVSGNLNPLVAPSTPNTATAKPVAPSMWIGSLISSVLGNVLPGPGTLYRMQTLRFSRRVTVGERLLIQVTCVATGPCPKAVFETLVIDASGQVICEGLADVDAPTERMSVPLRDPMHLDPDDLSTIAPKLAAAS